MNGSRELNGLRELSGSREMNGSRAAGTVPKGTGTVPKGTGTAPKAEPVWSRKRAVRCRRRADMVPNVGREEGGTTVGGGRDHWWSAQAPLREPGWRHLTMPDRRLAARASRPATAAGGRGGRRRAAAGKGARGAGVPPDPLEAVP